MSDTTCWLLIRAGQTKVDLGPFVEAHHIQIVRCSKLYISTLSFYQRFLNEYR